MGDLNGEQFIAQKQWTLSKLDVNKSHVIIELRQIPQLNYSQKVHKEIHSTRLDCQFDKWNKYQQFIVQMEPMMSRLKPDDIIASDLFFLPFFTFSLIGRRSARFRSKFRHRWFRCQFKKAFAKRKCKKKWRKKKLYIYLNELHGWMTQCPAVFWRIRSLTRAFLLPNNFIASRLSVGWNHDCSWFFKKFDDIFSVNVCKFGNGSSFGVPYSETSSKWTCSVDSISVSTGPDCSSTRNEWKTKTRKKKTKWNEMKKKTSFITNLNLTFKFLFSLEFFNSCARFSYSGFVS